MTIKYVKHDRPVTAKQIEDYGKLATHDIHVPILVLYPIGKIKDKNGIEADIDEDFIKQTMKVSNDEIRKKFDSPFAKVKSFIANAIGDYECIPLIKNHNTGDVDNHVGHTKGLFYTEKIDGQTCLLVNGVFKDIEAKSKIDGGLFRHVSMGTRPDGSIKEISLVSNEAIPHAGLMMSDTEVKPTKTLKELELAEQINGLQFEEALYENTIIPNHMILSRMIKTGKIVPWGYEEHIKTSTQAELLKMERTIPAHDLGLMLGTNRDLEYVLDEEVQAEFEVNKIINQYQKKTGKVNKNAKPLPELPQKHIEMIKQGHSFEEKREKELKHILELAEHSPEIAAKYIKCELGETTDDPKYKDILLMEYIGKLKDTKSKLKTLQLGDN
jgi:hypothetical protein